MAPYGNSGNYSGKNINCQQGIRAYFCPQIYLDNGTKTWYYSHIKPQTVAFLATGLKYATEVKLANLSQYLFKGRCGNIPLFLFKKAKNYQIWLNQDK